MADEHMYTMGSSFCAEQICPQFPAPDSSPELETLHLVDASGEPGHGSVVTWCYGRFVP